ncbi:MAG: hypothetical protein OIN88_10620 [Candidatus Methanoperedens sp.]|nr:hypothetical protein [Candidatus Methanoperedens sp.]
MPVSVFAGCALNFMTCEKTIAIKPLLIIVQPGNLSSLLWKSILQSMRWIAGDVVMAVRILWTGAGRMRE